MEKRQLLATFHHPRTATTLSSLTASSWSQEILPPIHTLAKTGLSTLSSLVLQAKQGPLLFHSVAVCVLTENLHRQGEACNEIFWGHLFYHVESLHDHPLGETYILVKHVLCAEKKLILTHGGRYLRHYL